MEMWVVIVFVVILFVLPFLLIENVGYTVYGPVIPAEKSREMWEKFNEDTRLNLLCDNIMVSDSYRGTFISDCGVLRCKYHFNDIGRISRWDPVSKEIDKRYKELNEERIKSIFTK